MNKRFWSKRNVKAMSNEELLYWINKVDELRKKHQELNIALPESNIQIHKLITLEKFNRGWA
jgi:hypothetical protein